MIFTGSIDDALVPIATTRQLHQLYANSQVPLLEFAKGGHNAAFLADNCYKILEIAF